MASAERRDDELIAGVLKRILHDPDRHESQNPFVLLGENELLIDGRIGVTDDEYDALMRSVGNDILDSPWQVERAQ